MSEEVAVDSHQLAGIAVPLPAASQQGLHLAVQLEYIAEDVAGSDLGMHVGQGDGGPLHVARFGPKFDAQGVLAGSKDSGRCIGYLTKYLTKHVADCHQADSDSQRQHVDRLMEALRFEPCSPTCGNWLRYGIQPKDAREGLRPGACKGKAHRREHLGYAGRRVLVSRKWSGKTLADHRGDRKAWLMAMLDRPPTTASATGGTG